MWKIREWQKIIPMGGGVNGRWEDGKVLKTIND